MLSIMTETQNQTTQFPMGQQSDAHSFILYLLNYFESVLVYMEGDYSATIDVRRDFFVENLQRVECQRGHSSETIDKCHVIINLSPDYNIQHGIKKFFEKQVFSICICNGNREHGSNVKCSAYYCDECDDFVSASKSTQPKHLPKLLIVNCNASWVFRENQVIAMFEIYCSITADSFKVSLSIRGSVRSSIMKISLNL
jgi:uncharacterized UBP type Zn finger protein